MPFQSLKQTRYMFKNKPKLAREWVQKYGMPAQTESKKYQRALKQRMKGKGL